METPQEINIYSSDVHPFALASQFLNATKVIKVNIKDFVSLAEMVGDPQVPVIWLSNTGRCGGTMLCQVFESLPGTLAIMEPDPPTNVLYLNERNVYNGSEFRTMLKSTIRVMCKPRPGVIRICIKPRPQCTVMMSNIRELFKYQPYIHLQKQSRYVKIMAGAHVLRPISGRYASFQ